MRMTVELVGRVPCSGRNTLRRDAVQLSLPKRLPPCLPFCSCRSPRSLTHSVSLERCWLRRAGKTGCAILLLLWFSN